MNYKEALFFIGKSLTINHEKHNKIIVEKELISNNIDWDAIVKVSTAHFVFPALYCNLKKAKFLHYLPSDLVDYMKHITDLNRERNQQIIDQAKEINELLLANNITPIFLKGTGNLLEGLYDDIAERMVGDIDIIIDLKDISKSKKILIEKGYSQNTLLLETHRHIPRLVNKNKIGAIEIHKHVILENLRNIFNFKILKKDLLLVENFHILSYDNQLNMSIISKQINDKGYSYIDSSLRNAFDVFLFSKKTIAKDAFKDFQKIYNPINCFLASCYIIFNKPVSLKYTETKQTKKYLKKFNKLLSNSKYRNKRKKRISLYFSIKEKSIILLKSVTNKNYRKWLKYRLNTKLTP